MKIFSRFLSLKKTLEAGLLNNKISSSDIYLISHKGEPLGIRKLKGVLSTMDKSIDLIQVSPASPAGSNIPTVKEFLKAKQGNSARNSKEQEKKPIKSKIIEMYSCIDEHDLDIKIEKIQTFLSKGHQVKVCIGRKPGAKKLPIGLARSAKDISKSVISTLKAFKSKVDFETLHQVQLLFYPKKSSKS